MALPVRVEDLGGMSTKDIYDLVAARDRDNISAMAAQFDDHKQAVNERLDRHEDNVKDQFAVVHKKLDGVCNDMAALVGTENAEGSIPEVLRLARESNATGKALVEQMKTWHEDEDVPFRTSIQQDVNTMKDQLRTIATFIKLVQFVKSIKLSGSKEAKVEGEASSGNPFKEFYTLLTATGVTWIGLVQFLRATSTSATRFMHDHRALFYGLGIPAVLALLLVLPRVSYRAKR